MSRSSGLLHKLADLYEESHAGRTGRGQRDLIFDYEQLLADSGCRDGDSRLVAERELSNAADAGLLKLVAHKRDPQLIQQVRFSSVQEEALFAKIGRPSPRAKREKLAEMFARARRMEISAEWEESWVKLCGSLQEATLCGASIQPFSRDDFALNEELLLLIPKIMAWKGESLIRFASCVLCKNSKRLQVLEGKICQILNTMTGGKIRTLDDVGIVANPHFVLLHGPLKLLSRGSWINFSQLAGPFRISEIDIKNAERLELAGGRCLSIENETTFHELAKLRSGELLVQTSFPNSAVLALFGRLPSDLEFWHFGDSDPEGFDILRDLRERCGRQFRSLQMQFRASNQTPAMTSEQRTKLQRLISCPTMVDEREEMERMLAASNIGLFEQEQLGKPHFSHWPFYKLST